MYEQFTLKSNFDRLCAKENNVVYPFVQMNMKYVKGFRLFSQTKSIMFHVSVVASV